MCVGFSSGERESKNVGKETKRNTYVTLALSIPWIENTNQKAKGSYVWGFSVMKDTPRMWEKRPNEIDVSRLLRISTKLRPTNCALQSDAVCCGVLQCVAVCCGVLQCVAVCCSVLQCVAVCCIT